MLVKTDRKVVRGIAQLLRMGWYRPVHSKGLPAQEMRALLTGRKLLQAKLLDVEAMQQSLLGGPSQGRPAACSRAPCPWPSPRR